MAGPTVRARSELMTEHAEARRRRERAVLGSDEFIRASEEIARIEIAIARIEEPPPKLTGAVAAALATEGAAGPPQGVKGAGAQGGSASATPGAPVHGDASTAPANPDPRRRTGKAAGVRAEGQPSAPARGRRSSSPTS